MAVGAGPSGESGRRRPGVTPPGVTPPGVTPKDATAAAEPSPASGRLDAFVSYRRLAEDAAFVDRLQAALRARGKQVWVDRRSIEPAADWSERVVQGITSARALLFVLTPESVVSAECRRELDQAVALHKLVVPVVLRDVEPAGLPDALTRPNWTFFTPGHDFEESLAKLVEALEGDLGWRDEHTRLALRSGEWSGSKRDRSFLLRGTDLRLAERWLAEAALHDKTPPTSVQTEYILASRRAADRSQRTWRGALSAGLALALALAAFAFVQRNQARHERDQARTEARLAQARALAAEATADLSTDPQRSLSEALASTRIVPSGTGEQALRLALAAARQRMVIRSRLGSATLATWNPSRPQVALTAPGHTVELWDVRDGRLVQVLRMGFAAPVTELSYDPSGRWLAAVAADGDVSVWDTPAGTPARPAPMASLASAIRAAAFHAYHGDLFISAVWAGTSGELDVFGGGLSNVLLFDPLLGETGRLFRSPLSYGAVEVTPSPDGSQLLVDGDLIDLRTDAQSQLPDIGGEFTDIGPACWLPGGRAVATWTTVDAGGPIDLWSASTHKLVASMQLPIGPTTAIACSAGGADGWLAGGDSGGNLLLRLGTGRVVSLFGHGDAITAIASSPDGRELATASRDGTARVWDAATGRQVAVLAGDGAPLHDVRFGPGGGLVLTVDDHGLVRIWDAGLGEPVTTLQRPAGATTVALGLVGGGRQVIGLEAGLSSGSRAAVASATLLGWDASTGRLVRRLDLPGIAATSVPCSPALKSLGQDARLATTSPSGCNLPPPSPLSVGVPVTGRSSFGSYQLLEPLAVAVSADGGEVAYATGRSVAVLDRAGRRLARLAPVGAPTGLAFSGRAGQLLVTTTRAVELWKPLSGDRARVIAQGSAPVDAALSASGARLATASASGLVQVFDVASGKRLLSIASSSQLTPGSYFPPEPLRVALDGGGRVVVSGNEDGTVAFFDVASGRLIASRTVSAWPIIELETAAGGSRLLAVDWPAAGTGANPGGAAAVLATSTGRVLASYRSPPPVVAPIDPGAALSPDGSYLFAGTLGLAPSAPGGFAATYQVSTGQTMADLQSSADSVPDPYSLVPADPWSPDGSELLIGDALYSCDPCGTLRELQGAAESRLAWAAPLSDRRDRPPSTDPYR